MVDLEIVAPSEVHQKEKDKQASLAHLRLQLLPIPQLWPELHLQSDQQRP